MLSDGGQHSRTHSTRHILCRVTGMHDKGCSWLDIGDYKAPVWLGVMTEGLSPLADRADSDAWGNDALSLLSSHTRQCGGVTR